MDRGLEGDLEGIEGFFVGATWPSLYSGTSPARHGFHYLLQLQPGTYTFHHPRDHGISWQKPFWARLSEAGRRVAVLDVPLTRLDPTLNGIQIVEWGGHDAVYGFQASPGNLVETIRRRFGNHPLGPSCDGVRRTPGDFEAFLGSLLQGIRTKGELTRYLLKQGPWDLFMQVFTESHCVGHQAWHLHDPGHPAYDPAMAEVTGDPLLRVYRAVDAEVGRILEEAGDTTVLVFSAHGMGPFFGAHFLLRDLLFRLGVASPQPGDLNGVGSRIGVRASARALALGPTRWAWRKLPARVRNRFEPVRQWVRDRGPGGDSIPSLGVDLSSSLCFQVPNGLAVGGIRLNLQGREPHGTLAPEAGDAFCEALTRDLLAIRDERTSERLIRRVIRTRDLYRGEHLSRLPDLLVEWEDRVPTGSTSLGRGEGAVLRVFSEKAGTLEGANDYGRSGEHRRHGMFVASGPGIPSGRMDRAVSVMDLAPTLSRRLGLELPGSDGIPVAELSGGAGSLG